MTQQVHARRWRAFSTIAVITAVSALALTGCSATKTSSYNPKAPVTLAFDYLQTTNSPMKTIVADYEKLHPNVKINLAYTTLGNYSSVVQTSFQGGNGPDLFWATVGTGDPNSITKFANAGYAEPLNAYSWATKSIPATAKSLFQLKGKVYAIPLDEAPEVTIYNMKALNAIGYSSPAKTLSGIYEQCAAAKSKGKTLFNIAGSLGANAGIFAATIAASNVYSANPNWNADRAAGKVTFAGSKTWKATLQTILDLNSKGCFQAGAAGGSVGALFSGVASGANVALAAPAGISGELNTLVPGSYKSAAFPGKTSGDTRLFSSPSDVLGVNSKSKHVQAALAFAEYMTKPAVQDKFAAASGALSMTTLTSGKYPDDLSFIAPLLGDPKKTLPDVNATWPNAAIYTALGTGVQGLLSGQASVSQVLQSMDSAWGSSN